MQNRILTFEFIVRDRFTLGQQLSIWLGQIEFGSKKNWRVIQMQIRLNREKQE